MILCESKATATALREMVGAYVCPIAGIKGQSAGFLRTVVAPELARWNPHVTTVIYLGDLDRSGHDIEENAHRVLERDVGSTLNWQRFAMTEALAKRHGIEPIWKLDGHDGRGHWAVEVESLGQARLVTSARCSTRCSPNRPAARLKEDGTSFLPLAAMKAEGPRRLSAEAPLSPHQPEGGPAATSPIGFTSATELSRPLPPLRDSTATGVRR